MLDLSLLTTSAAAIKSPLRTRPTPGIYADMDNPSLPDEKLKKFAGYIGDIYTKTDIFDTNKVFFYIISIMSTKQILWTYRNLIFYFY